MAHKVTLLPGDGIGPEVTDAMRRCVDATGVNIEWDVQLLGETAFEKVGQLVPDVTIESIRKNKTAIKGPCTTPIGSGFRSVNVALRKILDLYVNLRPARSLGIVPHFDDVDIVLFRENTEDLYAGVEFDVGDEQTLRLLKYIRENDLGNWQDEDTAISLKVISKTKSERIIRAAFEYAVENGRKSVSAVHKANIIKYTDGLFLKTFYEVAKEYEGKVEAYDYIVDALMMQLVQKPETMDVLVLPNLYGDITSDLCAGLIGGLGIAPGANIGKDCAVFEPVHGSAPKHAGNNTANPTATILSSVMMLRHLGESDAATKLEEALVATIREGKSVTYDLAPNRDKSLAVGTQEFADAIIARMQ